MLLNILIPYFDMLSFVLIQFTILCLHLPHLIFDLVGSASNEGSRPGRVKSPFVG